MRSPWVSLELKWISKFQLQNPTYKQFRLPRKVASCPIRTYVTFRASPVGECLIWRFGDCQLRAKGAVSYRPFWMWLLECLSYWASALQAAWLFVSGKSTRAFNVTSIWRTFPPLLGPAVTCSGCPARCLLHWKCARIALFDLHL